MPTLRSWSGSPFEATAGYCRAVRVDDRIWVAGTGPFQDGEVVFPGDAGRQAERCFDIVREALSELGAGPEHVVSVRMYVTDLTKVPEISSAHQAAFGGHPPAATLVQVSGLVDPNMFIEVEAEAVVRDDL